jgi:RNA-directed DNA polymerase
MYSISFHNIRNLSDLSKNLSISKSDLDRLLKCTPQSRLYHKMFIPKKSLKHPGVRTVYKVIDPTLSLLQKNIETSINLTVKFPHCVQGFVKGRSTESNARNHLGKEFLLNLDIKNFFESIRIEDVTRVFQYLGCSLQIAEMLARLCTLDDFLAQGLSTSPVLANVVSMDMDDELLLLSEKYNCVFTRYSDDIAISGNDGLPSKAELAKVLEKNGFEINQAKFKVRKRGQNQYVTGLTVFDEKCPRIPKRIKKRLRLSLYYIYKYGFESHVCKILNIDGRDLETDEIKKEEVHCHCYELNKKLKGWIDYINSVEPKLAKKYYEQYNLIEEKEKRKRVQEIAANSGRVKELHLPRTMSHKLSNNGHFKNK